LELVCTDCQQLICVTCITTSHRKHDATQTDVLSLRLRSEMKVSSSRRLLVFFSNTLSKENTLTFQMNESIRSKLARKDQN